MRFFFVLTILGCLAGLLIVIFTLADSDLSYMDSGEWFVRAARCAVIPYCLAWFVQSLEETKTQRRVRTV